MVTLVTPIAESATPRGIVVHGTVVEATIAPAPEPIEIIAEAPSASHGAAAFSEGPTSRAHEATVDARLHPSRGAVPITNAGGLRGVLGVDGATGSASLGVRLRSQAQHGKHDNCVLEHHG